MQRFVLALAVGRQLHEHGLARHAREPHHAAATLQHHARRLRRLRRHDGRQAPELLQQRGHLLRGCALVRQQHELLAARSSRAPLLPCRGCCSHGWRARRRLVPRRRLAVLALLVLRVRDDGGPAAVLVAAAARRGRHDVLRARRQLPAAAQAARRRVLLLLLVRGRQRCGCRTGRLQPARCAGCAGQLLLQQLAGAEDDRLQVQQRARGRQQRRLLHGG